MSIRVEHLTYVYNPGTPGAQKALQDVSLVIEDGATSAIVGTTASGKSTLVQHFNGLLRPTEGSVHVGDICVSNARSRSSDLLQLRREVGLLFQFPETQLFASTVYDDVAFGPRQLGLPESHVRLRVVQALEAVALDTGGRFLGRSPFALSGGQRRRVALAGVLAMRPRVLVLDEPSAGLDAEGQGEIYGRLAELQRREGLTLIFISHDMAEVASLADHVFVLDAGRLSLTGTPQDLFRHPEGLMACGLLPSPLAHVTMLANARGWTAQPQEFTPEAVGQALAGASRRSSASSGSDGESGPC